MIVRVACYYGLMLEYKTHMNDLALMQEFNPTPETTDYITDPEWAVIEDNSTGVIVQHYIKRTSVLAWSLIPETQVVPAGQVKLSQ